MRTLSSANVARTCRTMDPPTITASRSVSRRGAKWFRVEISKTGGGGGGEVVTWGLSCVFCCCCTQSPRCPGAGVKDIWEDRVLGARGLCRETHGVEVVVPALLSAPSAGPASPPGLESASPTASSSSYTPNAARTRPHLHSKVDTNPPLKQVTVNQW